MDPRLKPRILIVEDDAGMRSSLEFLLESCGHSVAAYATLEEFLGRTGQFTVDCAILDVHLPGITGLELYRLAQQRWKAFPAIFITGHLDEAIKSEAESLNAIAVLEKPFSDEMLLDAVGRAIAS